MTERDPRKAYDFEAIQDKKTFRLYSARDFDELPDLEWRVESIFPEEGLALVYGPSGVGKSFLCLDLAAAIAEGRPWFGHQISAADVVYVALEGQAGIRMRVAAWEKAFGRPFPSGVSFMFTPFELNTTTEPMALVKEIEAAGGAQVIIIDTLNRAAVGLDENSSTGMGQVIVGANLLQMATKGLVLLIHHPGKDSSRGARGHSSLFAALDTVVEVATDGAQVRWKILKSKDGEGGKKRSFILRPVIFHRASDGKAISSCVIDPGHPIDTIEEGPTPKGANQQIALGAAFGAFLEKRLANYQQGKDTGPPQLPRNALMTAITDALFEIDTAHRKLRAKEALNRLIDQRFLIQTDEGICLP